MINWIYPPPRMPVTTRIITFFVGNPYKTSFVTVTGFWMMINTFPRDPGSPNLRMVSWNLNTWRFGGDYTPQSTSDKVIGSLGLFEKKVKLGNPSHRNGGALDSRAKKVFNYTSSFTCCAYRSVLMIFSKDTGVKGEQCSFHPGPVGCFI